MTDKPLLDIQKLDTTAEQLHHRHAHMPEREARGEAMAEEVRLDEEIAAIGVNRIEVSTRQKRLEDEAAVFERRADEDEKRLYSGDVGMKELQPLQDEIAGLRDRQSDLETEALEAMEAGETLVERLAAAEAEKAGVAERVARLESEIADIEDAIAAELDQVAADREAAAALVSEADLAEYDRLRPGMGSATVVVLEGGNCVGCPSAMPAVELDRMKHAPAGSTLSCSECGRIVLT